jgi:hypothetical protein
MIIEIQDNQIKEMYLAARKFEEQEGKSIPEILLEIIYGDDPQWAIAAIKIYYEITMSRDLDLDWVLEDDDDKTGELIPLDGANDSE